jgi:mRNA-degrading endonuclease toxin of MazEF toxin-antitoxin module
LKRGDVFWADLVPRSGSGTTGGLPVVIVSHDGFNQTPNWRSVLVVPVVPSPSERPLGLTIAALPAGSASLKVDSIAVCHQITALDRARLSQRLGSLSHKLLHDVDQALKAAIDME